MAIVTAAMPDIAASADVSSPQVAISAGSYAVEETDVPGGVSFTLVFSVSNTGPDASVKLGGAYRYQAIPSMEYEPHRLAGPKGSALDRVEGAPATTIPKDGSIRLSIRGPLLTGDAVKHLQHGSSTVTFVGILQARSGPHVDTINICQTFVGDLTTPKTLDCVPALERTTLP
ncbi:MAG TPA: hypothetical protein VMD91_10645 [Candidatus Sulfotelmatobacter sp.]|nr:hypothetical protein [Candidatus Sulfotelmatobacter sp.]